MAIRCITKDLTICKYHEQRRRSRRVDLIDVTTAFWPDDPYPCSLPEFCVYAELVNGTGTHQFTIRFYLKGTDEVLAEYPTHEIYFPDQFVIKPLAVYISDLYLPAPGVYLLKLFLGSEEVGETEFLAGEGDYQ